MSKALVRAANPLDGKQLLAAAVGMAMAVGAAAQDGGSGQPASSVDTVMVTGSRAVGRTIENSPAPIDVFTSQDVVKANKVNLLETVNVLVPSFNLPIQDGGTTSLQQAGQLRGLNSSHALVLVNGKRRHVSAKLGAGGFSAASTADLILIPSGAVSTIEVLRDGASAIYGSDAIAGVINIITNKSDEGARLSYKDGQTFDGDGRARSLRADAGFELGDQGGYLHVSGQHDEQEGTLRVSEVPREFLYYFPLDADGRQILPAGSLANFPTLPAGATPDPREATRDNYAWRNSGIRPYELSTVVVDAGLPVSNRTELYTVLTGAYRRGQAIQNFRHPSRDENVRAIWPDGFYPYHDIHEGDYEVVAGVKGATVGGWDWDLSAGYGQNWARYWIRDSINPTYGLDSKTDAHTASNDYDVLTANLDFRRSYSVGWASGPLQFSTGFEWRDEEWSSEAGDPQAYSHGGWAILDGPKAGQRLGAGYGNFQSATIVRPEDEITLGRSNTAYYAGLSADVTSSWLVDLAVRHERYSDFGNETTGRLTSRYEIGPRTAIRGTLSTGFQAPSVAAQAYQSTGISNTYTSRTLRADSEVAQFLGAKPLEPETSRSVSFGVVLEPTDWLKVAVDVYRIDVADRIAQSTVIREGVYPGAGRLVELAGLSINDGVSYFLNAADTRTEGIEFTVENRHELGRFGDLRWSVAAHYSRARITDLAETPQVLADLNIPLFGRSQQNTLLYQAPRNKHVFSATWNVGRWEMLLRETHYGAIQRWGSPDNVATSGPWAGQAEIAYDIGETWLTDLGVTYSFNDRLQASLMINNLFDERVRKVPEPLISTFRTWAYATGAPIDGTGGFYSAAIEWNW